MERHRNQTVNFRQSAFPLNGQAVPFLLKTRYQSLDIGGLFEFVADILWNLTAVRTSSLEFTIVNATSPFSGFSHGYMPIPTMARPFGKALLLTFAISAPHNQTGQLRRTDVRRRAVNVTQWGAGGRQDFVTIAVGGEHAHSLGLLNLQPNQLQYVYNTIGILTKAFIQKQTKYLPGTESYTDLHGQYNLHALRTRIGRMPLPKLFRDVPYPLWTFSIPLWTMAPNLVPQRCITPEFALYYFMYLRQIIAIHPNVVADVKSKRLGLNTDSADGVLGHLSDSVLNFVQMVKTPGDTQLTVSELLAPSVVNAVIATGKPDIDCQPGYLSLLSAEANDIAARMSNVDVGTMLLPPNTAARKLMSADPNFASTLLNAIAL